MSEKAKAAHLADLYEWARGNSPAFRDATHMAPRMGAEWIGSDVRTLTRRNGPGKRDTEFRLQFDSPILGLIVSDGLARVIISCPIPPEVVARSREWHGVTA